MLQISKETPGNSPMMSVPKYLLWMLDVVNWNTQLLWIQKWEELGGSKAGMYASAVDTPSISLWPGE